MPRPHDATESLLYNTIDVAALPFITGGQARGNDAERAKLERLMGQGSRVFNTVSQTLKKLNQTAMTTIRKIGG